MGLKRANELIFTADEIGAGEAERIGLVNSVVHPEELRKVAIERGIRLAAGPTRAIGLAKTVIQHGLSANLFSAKRRF